MPSNDTRTLDRRMDDVIRMLGQVMQSNPDHALLALIDMQLQAAVYECLHRAERYADVLAQQLDHGSTVYAVQTMHGATALARGHRLADAWEQWCRWRAKQLAEQRSHEVAA